MDAEARQKAVEVLEKQLKIITETYERDKAELQHAIRSLESTQVYENRANGTDRDVHPGVNRGRWKGMSITESIHAYLALYDKRPVPFKSLLRGLEIGGVNLGRKERWQANVKTTVVNNRRRFRYNKEKDTVELLEDLS